MPTGLSRLLPISISTRAAHWTDSQGCRRLLSACTALLPLLFTVILKRASSRLPAPQPGLCTWVSGVLGHRYAEYPVHRAVHTIFNKLIKCGKAKISDYFLENVKLCNLPEEGARVKSLKHSKRSKLVRKKARLSEGQHPVALTTHSPLLAPEVLRQPLFSSGKYPTLRLRQSLFPLSYPGLLRSGHLLDLPSFLSELPTSYHQLSSNHVTVLPSSHYS